MVVSPVFLCVSLRSPRSYVWERKDGELSALAKVDGAFLVFEMLNKSDNGVYQCQIDNGIGKSEGVYTLQVQGTHTNPGVTDKEEEEEEEEVRKEVEKEAQGETWENTHRGRKNDTRTVFFFIFLFFLHSFS